MILRSRVEAIFLLIILAKQAFTKVFKCPDDKFSCDTHNCIPQGWVCDGTPDCRDNTDEDVSNCPVEETKCRADQFECGTGSGICIPGSWKCDGGSDCPDGSDEDMKLCTVSCTDAEFRCDDGQCISLHWKCNGLADCEDESDEKNCSAGPPAKETGAATDAKSRKPFRCPDGFTIPHSWVCDGTADCRDGTDEKGCEGSKMPESSGLNCKSTEFECPDSFCIPKEWVCDGRRECIKGEDEMNCPPRNCTDYEHKCDDGTCILFSYRCNGEPDCPDRSDEAGCPSTSTTTTSPKPTSTTQAKVESGCNPDTHFLCENKLCISNDRVCDGTPDCGQSEDESEDQCGINECKRNNGGCIQKCVNTREGNYCDCDVGFRLVGKYNCEDIDECKEIPGVCSQKCTNTYGNFHCSCLPGYMKDPANYTRCKAAHGEVFLLFSHSFDIRQLRLRDRDMTSVVEDTRRAIALDYVFSDGQILWSDNKENKIYRANLTNTNERQVLVSHEEVSAEGLAVDWIHKNVYYTNRKKDEVFLLSWDGKWLKTIVKEEIGSPRAIAISPDKGYIFWTDWGANAKIERASLDGSDRVAIVDRPEHVKWPNGLTIDHPTERIYWCDGFLRTIFSADIDGSHVEVILYSPAVLHHPFSISVFEDRIYWTDWTRLALFSADKFTGGAITNVSAGHLLEAPKVVHVFHEYRQPIVENVCEGSLCQHFCVKDSLGEALCLCADGYQLDDDKISCIVEVKTTTENVPSEPSPSGKPMLVTSTSDNVIANDHYISEEIKLYKEGERSSQVGFILGGTFGAAVVVAAVVALYVVYMRTSRREISRVRFTNPVYKKTTIDIDDELFCQASTGEYQTDCVLTDRDDVPLTPKDDNEE